MAAIVSVTWDCFVQVTVACSHHHSQTSGKVGNRGILEKWGGKKGMRVVRYKSKHHSKDKLKTPTFLPTFILMFSHSPIAKDNN